MHIARKFRCYYFSGNVGPFQLKIMLLTKEKICIFAIFCRKFLSDDFFVSYAL